MPDDLCFHRESDTICLSRALYQIPGIVSLSLPVGAGGDFFFFLLYPIK